MLMSVAGIFNAIPPESSFYENLKRNALLRVITNYLFVCGGSIYDFFEMESEEVDVTLQELIDNISEVFSSDILIRNVITEYRSEIILTRQNYPSIENRYLILYGSSIEIQERLIPELLRRQINNAEEFVSNIFYGDDGFGQGEVEGLSIITRQVVSQGVNILQQINAEELFSRNQGRDSSLLEDFEDLRNLYRLVDENNEEILVSYE
jgi:hypothetical protein